MTDYVCVNATEPTPCPNYGEAVEADPDSPYSPVCPVCGVLAGEIEAGVGTGVQI